MTAKDKDPFKLPAFSVSNRIFRFIWGGVYIFLFRPSPRPLHFWRIFLLKMFGAKIGPGCAIYPSAKIWAPWNLQCEDTVAIADNAEIYNPAKVMLRSHAIISQGAYLCGATHDYLDSKFPLLSYEIEIGRYAWVCARAVVMPGVFVGEGAILALGGIATHDLVGWKVYGGIPAREIGSRRLKHDAS